MTDRVLTSSWSVLYNTSDASGIWIVWKRFRLHKGKAEKFKESGKLSGVWIWDHCPLVCTLKFFKIPVSDLITHLPPAQSRRKQNKT
jgi:hypothetical protein